MIDTTQLTSKTFKIFSNKNIYIYCEKPVAIDQRGIDLLKRYLDNKKIMVGFNRRFAPLIIKLKNQNILWRKIRNKLLC